ncbi:MAG TPA: NAD(P)-dependent oxidoreductase [Bacillota bacterium]|nr:NAD(P)-dependent oxidoreductase [Bacillota bacterium]
MPLFLKGKRVLVTGASGFIGSHVAERLVKAGNRVAVMVRQDSDLWRLKDFKDRLSLCRGDLRVQQDVENCVGTVRPEYVFHMGAYGVDSRHTDPVQAVSTNVLGMVFLVKSLLQAGCKKLINVGSCMEYGNKDIQVKEDAHLEPFNIYGSSKAAGSIIAHQLAAEHGLPVVTLRAFGVFGEREGCHKFFPHIILSILQGKEVKLTGCEQYRDYCYVDNLVDAIFLAAGNEECQNDIFNVGSGTIRPLRDYVEMVYQRMDSPVKPQYGAIPYRPVEFWRPWPDTEKIRATLQWKPRISLEEGLDRTIDWYKRNLDKYLGTKR